LSAALESVRYLTYFHKTHGRCAFLFHKLSKVGSRLFVDYVPADLTVTGLLTKEFENHLQIM